MCRAGIPAEPQRGFVVEDARLAIGPRPDVVPGVPLVVAGEEGLGLVQRAGCSRVPAMEPAEDSSYQRVDRHNRLTCGTRRPVLPSPISSLDQVSRGRTMPGMKPA